MNENSWHLKEIFCFQVVKKKDIDELRDIMLGFSKEREMPSFETLKKLREQQLESEEKRISLNEGLMVRYFHFLQVNRFVVFLLSIVYSKMIVFIG